MQRGTRCFAFENFASEAAAVSSQMLMEVVCIVPQDLNWKAAAANAQGSTEQGRKSS